MAERTFLTPLNEATDTLDECNQALGYYAHALRVVGNEKIADVLEHIAQSIRNARERVEEGKSLSLDRIVNGAHQATTNMMNAALAVAGHAPSR